MYQDVLVSLPLQHINSSLYSNLKGKHGDTAELKVVINPDVAFRNKVCVVYAMGIADQSGFEQEMSKYCKELHAFDCTITPDAESVANKSFTFHQEVCIGSPTQINNMKS